MLAQVPEAVPTVPPPSNNVDEPDVPGVDIPVPDELPVSALMLDKFPAIELMPVQVVVLGAAGPSGEAPDVIGLTPGDASSVAPRGIPVGATAGAGPTGGATTSASRKTVTSTPCSRARRRT